MIEVDVSIGSRWRCTRAGSTLLVDGRVYTISDILDVDLRVLVEMAELPGFLFDLSRFETVE